MTGVVFIVGCTAGWIALAWVRDLMVENRRLRATIAGLRAAAKRAA